MPTPVRARQDGQDSLWGKLGGCTRPRLLPVLSSRLFSNVTFSERPSLTTLDGRTCSLIYILLFHMAAVPTWHLPVCFCHGSSFRIQTYCVHVFYLAHNRHSVKTTTKRSVL